MHIPRFTPATAALLGAVLVSACSDGVITGPEPAPAPRPSFVVVGQSCQTIDFEQFAHGAPITSVSVFGTTLTVTAEAYTDIAATPVVASTPYGYDSDNTNPGGDTDLEWNSAGARCPSCQGLGTLLVTQEPGGPIPLDATAGGTLTLSGFGASANDFYISSFTTVDHDDSEANFTLFVDGVAVGSSTAGADGNVQVVPTTSTPTINNSIRFVMGTATVGDALGSGALDNIVVCIRQDLGDEGCTPGYWKNHTGSWAGTGFSPSQQLEAVFDVPNSFGLDTQTLLQALNFGGGSGTLGSARILLRAAVAALLNAGHPNVDYPRTTADIIADVNAALASNNRAEMLELAGDLDADNNLGCSIDAHGRPIN